MMLAEKEVCGSGSGLMTSIHQGLINIITSLVTIKERRETRFVKRMERASITKKGIGKGNALLYLPHGHRAHHRDSILIILTR